MENTIPKQDSKQAAFDVVGQYDQDRINGFTDQLIENLIDLVNPSQCESILDAMAGDGNFLCNVVNYCQRHQVKRPKLAALEYSKVQHEYSQMKCAEFSPELIWGDMVTLTDRGTGEALEPESYDRIVVKSANHEIPLPLQEKLYQNIFKLLKPGGIYINMGFVFDDADERDEVRDLARFKDQTAGMHEAAENRHFLTRKEFYGALKAAGFESIECGRHFDYRIHSADTVEHYLSKGDLDNPNAEMQARFAKSLTLRRNNRIQFENEHGTLVCPGEITLATKPSLASVDRQTFHEYPYDFVRHIEAHQDLMSQVVSHVPSASKVLDLGCGIGLLAERLSAQCQSYHGIELSQEFIRICEERYGAGDHLRFSCGDMMDFELGEESVDCVTLINAIYLASVNPQKIIRRINRALTPGGRVIVSGPATLDGYHKAEPYILQQLDRDGMLRGNEALVAQIREANARLLTKDSHFWSAEGMAMFLSEFGFKPIEISTAPYYNFGYLVVAEKI